MTDLTDGPEVFASEVFGRRAGLQVVLSGESAQPHQLAVAVQRIPAKAQHQRRERRALHLGVNRDPEEERVRGDFLQLVGRHVQSDDKTQMLALPCLCFPSNVRKSDPNMMKFLVQEDKNQ